ncbi:caspase family protein [Methylobacterium sp. 37f]|uniref:caspase family protein n=1 Tax=Methylobacterium sp. 37f TaxID=2817058 RepID=UPI001FFCC55D|nr:caspase family protein [Methylobacterium sp. 37f]MCK2056108.1 caspase family protein [Methylobacterium sp. 37f]
MAARAVLLVALALFLKGEGVQAAERASTPERRVALVIGNSNYVNFRPSLPNPRNDAEDVSAALKEAGFEVFLGVDLTKRGMEDLLYGFARAAIGADAAVTYYAGHGLQYQGRNYLVPVDAKIEDEIDINRYTVKVNDLVDGVSLAKGVRIIILDACRNLPLDVRGNSSIAVDSGLARISGRGLVVAYATQANALAYDGTGRNSLFTAAFLQAMKEPGLDLPQFFQDVSTTVDRNSDRRQTPELSLSYPGKFFFNRSETATQAWERVYDSNAPKAYKEFIQKYPKHYLADAARGRMIVIEEEIRRKESEAERELQRLQADLLLRRKQEDEARLRKQEDEARLRKQEDEARLRRQEDEARLRKQEDEARLQRQEEDARLRRQREADARMVAEEEKRRREFEEEVDRRVAAMELKRREAEARQARKPDPVERQYAMLPPGTTGPAPDGRDLGTSRTTTPDKTPSDKVPPESAFPPDVLERDRLHRETEAELGRIGCLREGADTEWNDTSIAALSRYARQAKSSPIPDEPTPELLDLLRRQPAHFCPIECGAGQRPSGDTCIAATRPEQQPKAVEPAEQKAVVHKPAKPKPESAPEPRQAIHSKPKPEPKPKPKPKPEFKPEPKQARERIEPRHQALRTPTRHPVEAERARPRPAPPPVAVSRPPPAPAPAQVTTSTAARSPRGGAVMGIGF